MRASICARTTKTGDTVWQVRWRQNSTQTSLTFTEENIAAIFRGILQADGPAAAMEWATSRDPEPEPDPSQTWTLDRVVEHHIDHLTGITAGTRHRYRAEHARTWSAIDTEHDARLGAVLCAGAMVQAGVQLPGWLPFAMAGGAAVHVAGDMITRQGCPLGWPTGTHRVSVLPLRRRLGGADRPRPGVPGRHVRPAGRPRRLPPAVRCPVRSGGRPLSPAAVLSPSPKPCQSAVLGGRP